MKHVNLNTLLIIAGIILLLIMRECEGVNNSVDKSDSTTVINNYYDSTIKHITVQNIYPVDSIPSPIPPNIDTMAIVKWYYTTYIYRDTIRDTSMVAMFNIKVKENRIDSLGFSYKWLKPYKTESTIKITKEENKIKLFAGVHAGASLTGIKSFGPEVFLVTPKDHAYKINYNLLDQSIEAGTYWKFSFKKK